jgi:hypothetical protein
MLLARQMKIKLDSITFDIEGDYGTAWQDAQTH